jgi:hypothetical protein
VSIGFGVPICGRTQCGGDLGGRPRPLAKLVDDVVDGCTEGITASDVRATRRYAVEREPRQVRSHCSVDDVGGRLVLARNGVQRRYVDARDVRLSHTRLDAGEPQPVPANFSAGC